MPPISATWKFGFLNDGGTEVERKPLNQWSMSGQGKELLKVMEGPITRIVNGQTEYKNVILPGESAVTIGWGVYLGALNQTQINDITQLVNGKVNEGQWITEAEAEAALQYLIGLKEVDLVWRNTYFSLNIGNVTQYEFDALLLQVFNSGYPEMLQGYFVNGTDEQIVQAILDKYRTLSGWSINGVGWEKRVRAQVQVFKHNTYPSTVY